MLLPIVHDMAKSPKPFLAMITAHIKFGIENPAANIVKLNT